MNPMPKITPKLSLINHTFDITATYLAKYLLTYLLNNKKYFKIQSAKTWVAIAHFAYPLFTPLSNVNK